MVAHAGGAGREYGQIGAALLLQLELTVDDAVADFVVADRGARRGGAAFAVGGDLLGAPCLMLARRRGVMAVAVDDHGFLPLFARSVERSALPAQMAEEVARPLDQWRIEDLRRRPLLDDRAALEHHDMVGDTAGKAH